MSKFLIHFISFLIGYLIASIQLNPHLTSLRKRIFWILIAAFCLALCGGYLFYFKGIISTQQLYLLLVTTLNSVAVLILTERFVKRHWFYLILIGAAIAFLNFIFTKRHLIKFDFTPITLGFCAGIGYLLNGILKKVWCKKEQEY